MKPKFYAIKRPPLYGLAIDSSWRTVDLCRSYSWPQGLPGGGKIGVIEFSGGWLLTDVEQANRIQGIPTVGIRIADVSTDGVSFSDYANGGGANGEVALDIQIAIASYFSATGKLPAVNVYWESDSFARAINRAVADGCAVISISWGAPEGYWTKGDRVDLQAACVAAEMAGVTIFVASGDNNADDGTNMPTVDCPASCPNVIGVGGTRKLANVSAELERVWHTGPNEGSGGGWSRVWGVQRWQTGAPYGGGRMVPDITGNADPYTGYKIIEGGQTEVYGGTSCSAPLMAGLFAAMGPRGTCKNARAKLWGLGQTCFNDITVGNNGYALAVPGPDAASGLGSPIGTKIAALFGLT